MKDIRRNIKTFYFANERQYMTFNEALRHAKIMVHQMKRKIIWNFPIIRYYALNIDKCPRDDTREAACKIQKMLFYAKDIDSVLGMILGKPHAEIQ